MQKVLFVCLGNICRSPLGEAIFNHKVKNLDMWADSAGTAAYHIGKSPDHRSIQVAEANGVAIDHKARQFTPEDFDEFDYVIAMDRNNYNDMIYSAGKKKDTLYLLREFDPLANGEEDVPDPYYDGYNEFETVFEMVDRSIDQLIEHMLAQK